MPIAEVSRKSPAGRNRREPRVSRPEQASSGPPRSARRGMRGHPRYRSGKLAVDSARRSWASQPARALPSMGTRNLKSTPVRSSCTRGSITILELLRRRRSCFDIVDPVRLRRRPERLALLLAGSPMKNGRNKRPSPRAFAPCTRPYRSRRRLAGRPSTWPRQNARPDRPLRPHLGMFQGAFFSNGPGPARPPNAARLIPRDQPLDHWLELVERLLARTGRRLANLVVAPRRAPSRATCTSPFGSGAPGTSRRAPFNLVRNNALDRTHVLFSS